MGQVERPGPEEQVCYNCKHMLWLVGIGQGVRCGYKIPGGRRMTQIPSLRYTCDKFEWKDEEPKPEGVTNPA
jgi:hypothetical protein